MSQKKPSEEMPWLKYYKPGAYEEAIETPQGQTIWQFYKPIFEKYGDDAVIEYFNRSFSGEEYINLVESWARTFRSMGIEPDEMVPVYGTWSPDISAMFFALNAVGAHPYFEKIGIVPEDLEKETGASKVAIVHSSLWGSVQDVFTQDKFKKVIISTPQDLTYYPMKGIITAQSYFEAIRNKSMIPRDDKFLWADDARKIGNYYTGEYEVPFKPNRIAVINTSSGTTSSAVKGIVATNESALANIVGTDLANPNYIKDHKAFTNLPPSIATSLNSIFLLPIYRGMKVIMDPRINEDSLYPQITTSKPGVIVATGIYWERFFKKIEEKLAKGQTVDLSYADFYIMGGSGTTPDKLKWMNNIMAKCHAPYGIQVGYGLTEMFGVVTVNKYDAGNPNLNNQDVISVGLPIAGVTVGIFDENGEELDYGQRGEVWLKGPSIMQGYFGKPEKTAEVMQDGWFKTGDLAVMDEDGYLYYYGRKKQSIEIGGQTFYLFDIANAVRREFDLKDCMVEKKKLSSGEESIVVYFVQKEEKTVENQTICEAIDAYLESKNVSIDGYLEKYDTFELNPATFKPLTRVTSGFVKYLSDGSSVDVSYTDTDKEDVYEKITSKREKAFVLQRKK